MPVTVCPGCKARYKVPATAAGKRTTCKKCGQAFRISFAAAAPAAKKARRPAAPPRPKPQDALSDLDALAAGEALSPPEPPPMARPQLTSSDRGGSGAAGIQAVRPPADHIGVADGIVAAGAPYARYFAAVGRSLVLLRKPKNLLTFLFLWMALAAREVMETAASIMPMYMMSGFIWLGVFIISGWYMAFKLNLVTWAAGDEEELPPMVAEQGFWDGVVVPFRLMLVTYIFAAAPAVIFLVILNARMAAAVATAPGPFGTAVPIPGSLSILTLVALALIGGFVWPMMVLIVSCGNSILALFRLDLIAETIVKSLPAYLLTVLAVYAAIAGQIAATMFVWASVGDTEDWMQDWTTIILLPSVLVGITLYFDVVAMRAVGYYYCHFKDKFAWSWG